MKTGIAIFSTLFGILAAVAFVAYLEISNNTYNIANFVVSKDSQNVYLNFDIIIFNNSFLSCSVGAYSLNVTSGTVALGTIQSPGQTITSHSTTSIYNSLAVPLSQISLTTLLGLGTITVSGKVPIQFKGITIYNYPLNISEPLSSLI